MIPLFISTPELLFVLFVAVLLFGTDKIPEIARTLGKGMRQLRDATSEIKNEINKSVDKAGIDTSLIDEVKQEVEKAKEGLEERLAFLFPDEKVRAERRPEYDERLQVSNEVDNLSQQYTRDSKKSLF